MATRGRTTRLDHFTRQDDTLTHQVRFSTTRHKVFISCNCRAKPGKYDNRIHYLPMGTSSDMETARQLYNNPDNHYAPFTKEDESKW